MKHCISPILLLFVMSTAAYGADFSPSLTAYGHPDLQGNWTTETATPFQRPEELGDKQSYTAEEAQEWEADKNAELDEREAPLVGKIEAPEAKPFVDNTAEDQFTQRVANLLVVDGEYRTSIVVDPANGRMPLREDWLDNTFTSKALAAGCGPLDGPELAGPGPRCLIDFGPLPPAVAIVPLSPNYQIVQNEHYIMIYIEAGAETRIIRLSDEHQTATHKKWRGDSIGKWEGNTLVVHTNNFHPQSESFVMRSSELFEVEERFTLLSENEIFYRFTITDSKIYTQPFTGELAIRKMPADEKIYDYACHEGNYSLPGILAGARVQERDAAAAEN
jgi:hypothetical protein